MKLFRLLLASTLVCGSVLAFYVMARASGVQASVSYRRAAPAQANSGFSNLVQQRKTHAQVANDAGYTNFAYGPGELAAQADAFVDATGFVTHVQYNDAGNYYPHLIPLMKLLQAAGIRHIRDGWANDWDMSHYETQGYSQMCAAGIKLTLLMANKPTRLGLDNFQGYVNGCVEAWEGYNECDAGPPGTCTMAVTWLAAQRQSANDLGILSLGLSGASGNVYSQSGDISQYIDAQNLHSYRDNNQNPEDTGGTNLATPFGYGYASLQWWMHLSRGNAIGLPFEVTEVGYKSSPSVLSGEVPESVQAAYLVRTLLVNFAAGVKRTFLYELFDEPGGDWGVVHNDLTPKTRLHLHQEPAVAALRPRHNLSSRPSQLRRDRCGPHSQACALPEARWIILARLLARPEFLEQQRSRAHSGDASERITRPLRRPHSHEPERLRQHRRSHHDSRKRFNAAASCV